VRRSLSVVSWNLMGLDDRGVDERTEAACASLLLSDPPDVVLLQEVVPRSLHAHVLPHFAAAGFTVAPSRPPPEASYFCAIAVRGMRPLRAWRSPFPGSEMGRALLGLEVDWEGVVLRLCTAHLESLREGARERARQVAAVVEALGAHDGPTLFGGDTNLRDDEPVALGEVVDAFVAAGAPAGERATWWPLGGRGPRIRFDRLWLGGSGRWSVDAWRVGPDRRVRGLRWSDHLPVRAQLGWSGAVGGPRPGGW